ncbi:MAG TPA: DinB family protein [Candidatus Dormibacteraeota bacterium]|nr:DinB family protein [Candidatus Dormibacteraeota bacterium]
MQPAQALDSLPGVRLLEQTPIILEKLLQSASPEILQWKPAADRWSASEVLAYLTDSEQMFSGRARRMVEEKAPQFTEYDQEAAYASGKYSGGTANEHLQKFCHERDRSLSLLRYLPADAARRTGQRNVLGTITLAELMNEWASHDLSHIRQIAELYRARAFYANSGPFQRYSNPKP